jgi:hypothetical protein
MLWHFTLKEIFLAITLVCLGVVGLIWQASPAAAPIPVRSLLVLLGSLTAIMAVITGPFHRGLAKALASATGVIAGLVAAIFVAAFLLR